MQTDPQTPRIRTTKEKSGRYWFRVNDDDHKFISGKMNKNDVAEYFRGCHDKLAGTLRKREAAKKRRAKKTKTAGAPK